jgi:hypothetical protein
MGDNLETYFHHRVKAVYEDYLEERASGKTGRRRDLRAATDAAKALYHLREHIPAPYSKSWGDVALVCPDYALVRDVADADKHNKLRDQMRAVCDATHIEERIILTEYRDKEGSYRHAEKKVLLKLTCGGERDLFHVLTTVINYWIDELHALGHLGKLQHYHPVTRSQPVPREECNDSRIDFELIQGLAYTQSFQCLQYNCDTLKVEPVDLTGSDLRFTVYKPQYVLDINAINDVSGQKVSRSVTITDAEVQQIQALNTEEKQSASFLSLPKVQAAYHELLEEIRRLEQVASTPSPLS